MNHPWRREATNGGEGIPTGSWSKKLFRGLYDYFDQLNTLTSHTHKNWLGIETSSNFIFRQNRAFIILYERKLTLMQDTSQYTKLSGTWCTDNGHAEDLYL